MGRESEGVMVWSMAIMAGLLGHRPPSSLERGTPFAGGCDAGNVIRFVALG